MMIYISPRNTKVNYPTFSLPTIKTCIGSTPMCRKDCYAQKAEKQYKNTRDSRNRNLQATKNRSFVADMSELVRRKHDTFFRIHESGDFYNQTYLNKWIRICKKNPEKIFIVYTKAFQLDFSKAPDNMRIFYSVFPDTDMTAIPNDGRPRAYTTSKKTILCNYPDEKCESCSQAVKCKSGEYDIVFRKH